MSPLYASSRHIQTLQYQLTKQICVTIYCSNPAFKQLPSPSFQISDYTVTSHTPPTTSTSDLTNPLKRLYSTAIGLPQKPAPWSGEGGNLPAQLHSRPFRTGRWKRKMKARMRIHTTFEPEETMIDTLPPLPPP